MDPFWFFFLHEINIRDKHIKTGDSDLMYFSCYKKISFFRLKSFVFYLIFDGHLTTTEYSTFFIFKNNFLLIFWWSLPNFSFIIITRTVTFKKKPETIEMLDFQPIKNLNQKWKKSNMQKRFYIFKRRPHTRIFQIHSSNGRKDFIINEIYSNVCHLRWSLRRLEKCHGFRMID